MLTIFLKQFSILNCLHIRAPPDRLHRSHMTQTEATGSWSTIEGTLQLL